jgi:hypothetical protein
MKFLDDGRLSAKFDTQSTHLKAHQLFVCIQVNRLPSLLVSM